MFVACCIQSIGEIMSTTSLIELLSALFGLIPAFREIFVGRALRRALINEPQRLLKMTNTIKRDNHKYAEKYAETLRLRAMATEKWNINYLDIWLSFRLPATLVSLIPLVSVICSIGIGASAIGQYSDPMLTASCLFEYTRFCLICLVIPVMLPYLAIVLFDLQRKRSIKQAISQLRHS